MDTVVAFNVAKNKVADSPCMMFIGLAVHAVNVGWVCRTTTEVVAVSDPFALRAVRVYIVVVFGETLTVPLDGLTFPMLGVMLTVSAFSTFHASVEDCPASIVSGVAVKNRICTR